MSRKNKKGGYKHPDYIAIYRHTFKSPAWQALSVGARATYLELASNYNTKRMNAVWLAVRDDHKRLGASKNTIAKWLHELRHYGFIALVRGGSLGVEGYAIAQTFRLTDRPFGNTRATYDFQNWTGELFAPAKHTMTQADKERLKRRPPKKQNPVPTVGTSRPNGRDIEKSVPPSSLCPNGRDIETAPACPNGRDVTSLTSCRGLEAGVAGDGAPPVLSGLSRWSPPIPYTPELRRLYCEAMSDPEDAAADDEWSTPVLVGGAW